MVFAKHETRDTNHGLHAFHESQLPYPRFPTISHDFPAFPGISRPPPPPSADQVSTCPRAVRLSWSAARTAAPCRAARSLLSRALWGGMGRLWRGMGGILPLRKCPRSLGHSRWQPVVKPRVAPRAARRPSDKARRWSMDIFDRGATHFRRGISSGANQAPSHGFHESRDTNHESRLFSSRASPSGGETRLGPPTMVFTKHGPLCFSRDTNHATWFFPVPQATPRRATPSPTNGFFTRHESRDTNHGFFLACFDRRVVRNAG